VVGEAEIGHPDPETYFDLFDVYVNREIGDDGRAPVNYGEGTIYGADEGVDRITALKLFTFRSAEFLYAESRVGSLEPGKYADFVVIEKDYLSGPDTEVKDNKVIMTVLAGEVEYQDQEYKPEVR
jgi:predicted amidohydrolase YtcJ